MAHMEAHCSVLCTECTPPLADMERRAAGPQSFAMFSHGAINPLLSANSAVWGIQRAQLLPNERASTSAEGTGERVLLTGTPYNRSLDSSGRSTHTYLCYHNYHSHRHYIPADEPIASSLSPLTLPVFLRLRLQGVSHEAGRHAR